MSRRNHRIVAIIVAIVLLMPALLATATAQTSNNAFDRTWERTDRPIVDGQVSRTWMWGPTPFTSVQPEQYLEAPGGERQVVYFDKSRMEITNPDGDQSSIWYVTNGLLSTELITGRLQLGDDTFEAREPAQVNVAGDSNDPNGPTYATFNALLDAKPAPLNSAITHRVDRAGNVTHDSVLGAAGVTAVHLDEVTNHAIAGPFWEFMYSAGTVFEGGQYVNAKLFENPFFATGRPITEAYWAKVLVAETPRDVLMQCFERRCLTYTPDNPEGWQVEAGNVGQHYHAWRYGQDAPAPSLATLHVHFIDVGQADATLLWNDETTILIDTGDFTGNEVVPYLQAVGITDIDLLVGTHAHADHIGQFPEVLGAFSVGEVWLSGDIHTTQTFEAAIDAVLASNAAYHEPRAGENHEFGDVVIEVVHPASLGSDLNNNSIAMRIAYGDVDFLFTGDAEADAEAAMIARGHNLDADILHVGHHGSSTSTTSAFLDAVNPDVAIYSAGVGNSYGHPHAEVIQRLNNRGIEVYGTDRHGNIYVTTDGATYEVSYERRPDPHPAPTATPTQPPAVQPTATPTPPPAPTATPTQPPAAACVNINTASHADLQKIIHIGPERASEIISLRPFSSVSDLTRVSGIGPARIADILDEGIACV